MIPIKARFFTWKNVRQNISTANAGAIFVSKGTSSWTSERGVSSIVLPSTSVESEGIDVSLRSFCHCMNVMKPSMWMLPSALCWSTSNSTSIPAPLGKPSAYSISTTPVYQVWVLTTWTSDSKIIIWNVWRSNLPYGLPSLIWVSSPEPSAGPPASGLLSCSDSSIASSIISLLCWDKSTRSSRVESSAISASWAIACCPEKYVIETGEGASP